MITCPNCGTRNEATARFCIKCGKSLVHIAPPKPKPRGPGISLAGGLLVGLMVMALSAGVVYYLLRPSLGPGALVEATPEPPPSETATPFPTITITLPPPLAGVEFPTQAIAYPPEWPADLRYPDEFSVVETSSGTLADDSTGWAAKLRYTGDPQSAADLLSSFFTERGWRVVERTELDSGGLLILVQHDEKKSSGALVIDPDTSDPGYTKVVATVFP